MKPKNMSGTSIRPRTLSLVRSLAGVACTVTVTAALVACGSSGSSGTSDGDAQTTTVVAPPSQESGPASPSATEDPGPQPSVDASQGSDGTAPEGDVPGAGGTAGQAESLPESPQTVQSETFTTYQAQGNASEPFAQAVFSAFLANYNATGDTSPTLSVTSPTTGQTYTMTCTRPQGRGVGCVGGDNAAVLIY